MTAVVAERPAPAPASLSFAVDVIRQRTGLDVLVEDAEGTLLEYAVGSRAPDCVVRSLVAKDLSSLRAPASALRTLALIPGGPVIASRPEPGLTAVVIPVPRADGSAWLWLVGRGAQVEGPLACQLASMIAAGLPDEGGTSDVAAILSGSAPLPPGWDAHARTIAVLHSPQPAQVVRSLRAAARDCAVAALIAEVGDAVVLLALGAEESWLASASAAVERSGARARGAFCSAPAAGADLRRMHAYAGAAAEVSDRPLARCNDLASRVAVRHAAGAIASAPVGRDRVAALIAHDERRGTDLARTVLVWLDVHGDAGEASRRLCVHANTLRYRLRRAADVLAGDLTDADTRLEVHLRLRAELGTG